MTERLVDGARPSAAPGARVAVVDDLEVVADSLAAMIEAQDELTCVGIATTWTRACDLVAQTRPDVLLLDDQVLLHQPPSAVGLLCGRWSPMRVVVLVAGGDEDPLVRAIEAGAAGVVSKRRSLAELMTVVRTVASGQPAVSAEMLRRLVPRLRSAESQEAPALTGREHEILRLVASGLTNAAIGERLGVSVHTVRTHVSNMSAKVGAHSKLELVAVANQRGLLASG